MAGSKKWAAPRGRMHRAFRGLYANRMIQFGNKVSHAENKSRRTWKPNVQRSTVHSEALGRKFQFRMTTKAMRNIKKAGGLDEYLLKTKDSEIKFPFAIRLKEQIKDIRRAANPRGENKTGINTSQTTSVGPMSSTAAITMRWRGFADTMAVANETCYLQKYGIETRFV